VIVFAHAGHWLVQLAYLLPLGALVVAMIVGRHRERRERLAQERAARADGPPGEREQRRD
jgi:hypothetical protein